MRRLLDRRTAEPVDPVEVATFFSMAEVFGRCFLMAIELDASLVGRRCVVKFSYLDTRNDPHDRPRYEMSRDLEHFGVAGSHHFELLSPQLLEITSLTLTEATGSEVHRTSAEPGEAVSTGHLAVRPRARLSTAAVVVVGLVPRRYGVVSQSFAVTWLVAGTFAVAVLGRSLLEAWLPGAVVAAVLRRPRRHLLGAGALLILAGLYMTLPVPEPVRSVGWWAMLLAARPLRRPPRCIVDAVGRAAPGDRIGRNPPVRSYAGDGSET